MSVAVTPATPGVLGEPALSLRAPDAPARAPAIVVGSLTKRYPRRRPILEAVRRPFARPRVTVVRDVTFDVHEGELFGLLGLNGAGKTTLLKMLSTLVLPDDGAATVLGHDVATQGAAVRHALAAVTADERSLHWRLSARENLRLFAGLHRLSRREGAERVDDALATVGLSDAGDKMAGAFSSGMRQRLLVARALLARPRVLLLDEPTRSLDPLSAHEFRRFLRDELVVRRGCTVLLATHNAEEAFVYCDRVGVLHHGRLLALGSAASLAARFVEERYRVTTSETSHPAFAALERERLVGHVAPVSAGDGRPAVELEIVAGEEGAADVLRRLVDAGAPVTRFERVAPALSDLIARIAASADDAKEKPHA